MKIIHELTLDVSRQGVQASVPITQHDTGTHVLLIHLRDGSKEIKLNSSLTATLYLSNDSYEVVTVYTENGAHPNTLECNVTPYMSSNVGEITAQLQIFEGADRVFSAPEFMLVVKEDRSAGSTVVSSSPFAAVIAARDAARESAREAGISEDNIKSMLTELPIFYGDTLPDNLPRNYIQIGQKINSIYNATDWFRVVVDGQNVLSINSNKEVWAANALRAVYRLELGSGNERAVLTEALLRELLTLPEVVNSKTTETKVTEMITEELRTFNSIGTSNLIGRRGYYYSHIDTANKKIYLAAEQVIPQMSAGVLDDNFETPAYEVGDLFSIVNSAKYEHTAKIAAIDHNVITYEGTLPFTAIVDATDGGQYELEADDYSFSVPARADVGIAIVKVIGFAVGEGVSAAGNDSAGFGRKLLVLGDYGLGAGYKNIVGYCSIVGGTNNDIIANYSLVGGAENTTEGLPTSVIIGGKSHKVKGSYGITVGQDNTINGNKDVVGGAGNSVSGDENIVGGGSNTVSHARNLVGGVSNTVSNQRNVVGGTTNNISGQNNQVSGENNNIKTHNCSASGKGNTNTTGDSSIIGGEGNIVSGNASSVGRHMVAGHTNTVSDIENIVGGENNTVSSARCIVGGQRNAVTAKHGLTVGTGNRNNKPNSIVGGTYNNPSNNSVISIGNGTSDTARSNAFEVISNNGVVSMVVGKTTISEQQLVKLLSLIS